MHTPRLVLAALLLATPMLHSQDSAQPQKESNPSDEPFRIAITLKATEKGKTTNQRTYTLVATSGQRNTRPGVRDDSRISGMAEPSGVSAPYFDTDLDVAEFKITGNSVFLDLRISTDDLLDRPGAPAPDTHPIIRSRHYNVTPTLPIGKLVTVYSAADAVNDANVEIQVLVQPLNAK